MTMRASALDSARTLVVGVTTLIVVSDFVRARRGASGVPLEDVDIINMATVMCASYGAMRRAITAHRSSASASAYASFNALPGLAPVWALASVVSRSSTLGTRAAALGETFAAVASVAFTDCCFTASGAMRTFISAVVYMFALRVVFGAFAMDSVMVSAARWAAVALGSSAREDEMLSCSLGMAALASLSVKILMVGRENDSSNSITIENSPVMVLGTGFCALGAGFIIAGVRLASRRRRAARWTVVATVLGILAIPEAFYRAVFHGSMRQSSSPSIYHALVRFTLQTTPMKTLFALGTYWLVSVAAALYAIHRTRRSVSNTIRRKIFHFLVVIMFAPVMRAHEDLLRVAFAVAFALFAAVEFARLCDIHHGSGRVGAFITRMYGDCAAAVVTTKTSSSPRLVLDHFSLLLGVALPLWMSEGISARSLAPWSGFLTLGVGDSFAAIVGVTMGKHRVFSSASAKTIEGSLAFTISTIAAALCVSDVDISFTRLVFASALTAACELTSDGVDNFVLPFYFAALVR